MTYLQYNHPMLKNDLLLIIEEDLANRFIFFEKQLKLEKRILPLKNIIKRSIFRTLVNRVSYREYIFEAYSAIKPCLANKRSLFVSNSEGFIAKNILHMIRRDYPQIKLIVLQHGIFTTRKPKIIKAVVLAVANEVGRIMFGVYLSGAGFGCRVANKYIVYNKLYKDFLVKNGWADENVIVSGYYLKGNPHPVAPKTRTENQSSAVFLLQCLYDLGISSKKAETDLITRVINLLSNEFDLVYIKQHPYCNIELLHLPRNCRVIDRDLDQFASSASLIVSFFSTALIDLERLNVPTVAIKSKHLHVDVKVYDLFKFIHDFDLQIEEQKFRYQKNTNRTIDGEFYQSGISTIDALISHLNL